MLFIRPQDFSTTSSTSSSSSRNNNNNNNRNSIQHHHHQQQLSLNNQQQQQHHHHHHQLHQIQQHQQQLKRQQLFNEMASKVTCHGAGLVSGDADLKNTFTVFVQQGNIGGISVAFEGPSKPEIVFKDNKDGSVEVTYVPKVGGDYKIHVNYEDQPIKGSPFFLKIKGNVANTKKLVERITCSGDALKQGKVGVVNEVGVDCKDAGITGGLAIAMEGPSKPDVSFSDNKDGTLKVRYKPSKPGNYRLHLKFGEFAVPGSPFNITVS